MTLIIASNNIKMIYIISYVLCFVGMFYYDVCCAIIIFMNYSKHPFSSTQRKALIPSISASSGTIFEIYIIHTVF